MNDIHSPTVPSGPVSQPVSNGVGGKKTLPELIARKENLEAELSALGSVLDSVSQTQSMAVLRTNTCAAWSQYEHFSHHL